MTAKELEDTLRELHLDEMEVRMEGRPGHLVAVVSSPDFGSQDEATRQEKVWDYLLGTLTTGQRAEVEFVFTLTPQELKMIDQVG